MNDTNYFWSGAWMGASIALMARVIAWVIPREDPFEGLVPSTAHIAISKHAACFFCPGILCMALVHLWGWPTGHYMLGAAICQSLLFGMLVWGQRRISWPMAMVGSINLLVSLLATQPGLGLAALLGDVMDPRTGLPMTPLLFADSVGHLASLLSISWFGVLMTLWSMALTRPSRA